jgi:hypothetical protein
MIGKALALAAAIGLGTAPCAAASLNSGQMMGERRSGATAGVYFAVPFGGQRSGRSQAGLRLQTNHDYRDSAGARTSSFSANTLELRMLGEAQPTLFVADLPVTGRAGREARNNLMGGGIVTIVVIGLAVVGAAVIYNQVTDDDDDEIPN